MEIMQNQTQVKKRTETEKQQQSKRVVSTQTDADGDGDGNGSYQPYCPACRKPRDVQIDPPDQEDNYYEQNISVVRCADCGQVLGHLTLWPSRDESYMGI